MLVKTKYEKLDYQEKAIDSVVGLFQGVCIKRGFFQTRNLQQQLGLLSHGTTHNIVTRNWKEIVNENIKVITRKNKLLATLITDDIPTFDIEMETGTGKTYVFLRTIFELNKQHGFNKFIITVPSIAIREGILKTIQDTEEHFKMFYNVPKPKCFIYNSNQIREINEFAASDNIAIMIINIQSFKLEKNIFNQKREDLNWQKPLEIIKKTNPIIIIDEPQTTANTKKSNKAINDLNPLFKIRYSATFRKRKNECLLYKLNSIDAFKQKLVKEIVVHSPTEDSQIKLKNNIQLKKIHNNTADLSIKVYNTKNTKFKNVNVKEGDNIYEITKNMEYHNGYIVTNIDPVSCSIEFNNGQKIKLNDSIDSTVMTAFKRQQIRKTIELHLDKQLDLLTSEIKVLSLFFIDEVSKYRQYENDGWVLGEYAKYFEEEFIKIASQSKYKVLFKDQNIKEVAKNIHNGYFSIDNKKRLVNTKGDSSKDDDTYRLIMKDKDKLLSFESKLAFIFSHSALKEGWDNPNVFQICVLNKGNSEFKKRQEIGRGLRLCVNQNGTRIQDEHINTLSVITDESLKDFAKQLQKEMKEECGISYTNIALSILQEECNLNHEQADAVHKYLITHNYIDQDGEIIKDLIDNTTLHLLRTSLLAEKDHLFINVDNIEQIIKLVNDRANGYIKDGNTKIRNKIQKEVVESQEFQALWKVISQKTYYEVKLNTNELINDVVEPINKQLQNIVTQTLHFEKSKINVGYDGIKYNDKTTYSEYLELDDNKISLSKFIDIIAHKTNITKATIAQICNILNKEPYLIQGLKNNQEKTKNVIIQVIQNITTNLTLKNIKYFLANEAYSINDLLDNTQLDFFKNDTTYIPQEADKYAYEWVICDSKIEEIFSKKILSNEACNKLIKLPTWFKIPTPSGSYTPDWAICNNSSWKIVVETKGNIDEEQLRGIEKNKIHCAEQHFKAISNNIDFKKAEKAEEIFDLLLKSS